jgi:thioredoxin 1
VIERLALVLLLSTAAVVAFYALRRLHVRRMQPGAIASRPTLLYFRGDTCAICPTQGRIVDQIAAQWDGRLQIDTIDAEGDSETTARYSVFSLPTTILVDSDGRVRQVNYGFTDATKLDRQIRSLVGSESGGEIITGSAITEST